MINRYGPQSAKTYISVNIFITGVLAQNSSLRLVADTQLENIGEKQEYIHGRTWVCCCCLPLFNFNQGIAAFSLWAELSQK